VLGRALCIGINAYASSPLRNAVNDARAVKEALERAHFSATLLTDASADQMYEAIEAFVAKLEKWRAAVFFFAGHGCQASQ
jgi:uncharacterized caspase-like protein